MTTPRFLLIFSLCWCACNQPHDEVKTPWIQYDESRFIKLNADHENVRLRYQLIQSKFLNPAEIWAPFNDVLDAYGEDRYQTAKSLILDQDIPTLQDHIDAGRLTHLSLTKFFLYRMRKMELDSNQTLHAVLDINPLILQEAAACDERRNPSQHPIFGMPILLKDNIDAVNMPTTAGAAVLENHVPTKDAFIVQQMKEKGALILGKVNLSEWAYFFCDDCPLGYSAIGGQTLNPYGRMQFETGGSSAGSAVAVAANYAVAAIGTETSGSILSPSSKNAVVGLKPTVGMASRTGIVPISSTLDTPGPMTKFVIDNAIVLDAMCGHDLNDAVTLQAKSNPTSIEKNARPLRLDNIRLGAIADWMETDSLYRRALDDLEMVGAEIVAFSPKEVDLTGFLSVLNGDMKRDLPKYFQSDSASENRMLTVGDVMAFNRLDSLNYMPYGQARLEGIVMDTTTDLGLAVLIDRLHDEAKGFFDGPLGDQNCHAVLSINNRHAACAAMAFCPGITVPMGQTEAGEPVGLTFLAASHDEELLLDLAWAYESQTHHRQMPLGGQ